MRAASFGAFQPTHLQITRGGWCLPSMTSQSPRSSPLASKNRRCSMQLVTLDARSEVETGAKLTRVQGMLRNRIAGPRPILHSRCAGHRGAIPRRARMMHARSGAAEQRQHCSEVCGGGDGVISTQIWWASSVRALTLCCGRAGRHKQWCFLLLAARGDMAERNRARRASALWPEALRSFLCCPEV
jgi:hypothetical protein